MSPRGKHVPGSPTSFYASLGRHIAGGVAVVGVVALVIALATRDDDGAAVGVNSPTPTVTSTGTGTEPAPTTSATPTETGTPEPTREARPREEITVAVFNGNGTPGLASQTSDRILQAGYTADDIGDAAPRNKTVIFFAKGAKPEALLLLEDFPDLLRIKPASGDEIDDTALLTVILGDDYRT